MWQTSNSSSLLIYRPRKDERLSCSSWLTYSGRFTHISGYPSAAGRAQTSDRYENTILVALLSHSDFVAKAELTLLYNAMRCSTCEAQYTVFNVWSPIHSIQRVKPNTQYSTCEAQYTIFNVWSPIHSIQRVKPNTQYSTCEAQYTAKNLTNS